MSTGTFNDSLMTVPEAAELLRISPGRAYEMATSGDLPTVRLSARRIRVPRAALEAWLDRQLEETRPRDRAR